jgi:hypothetical protein
MKEVGGGQLSFTLEESSWMSHRKLPMKTCHCMFLRSEQRVLLLFAVWLLLLLSLKYGLWFSNGKATFFAFCFNNFFYID